jgi:hypothetical protein
MAIISALETPIVFVAFHFIFLIVYYVKLTQGSMVTMDMRMDRVRVFHDPATGMVTSIPRIG